MLNRWAPSTNNKYKRGWARREEWCRLHPESPAQPAIAFYIGLYFNDLVIDECKFGALTKASAGIRWGHLTAGFSNPMDNDFVKIVLEEAKRKVGRPPSAQKEPMSPEMVKTVVQCFGQGTNLLNHRTVVICLLGFSGFLRISELMNTQVKHLRFFTSHLEITIPKAKNDQLREGHIVHIKRLYSQFCPVHWLQDYLDRTGLKNSHNNYIISRLAKTGSSHKAHGYKPLA